MKKKWWIIIAVVVVVACLGYVGVNALQRASAQSAVAETTAAETAVVERGTMRVTVDGSGSLAPNDEVTLAFSSGGEVVEVLVDVGDVVRAGDVLARLDDVDARETIADAELQVAQAEINLALAQAEAELGLKQANLDAAQASYEEAQALAERVGDQLTSARVSLAQAQDELDRAQENYDQAWDSARDWELNVRFRKDALESEREATERALESAQYNMQVTQANYNLAVAGISEASVRSAWTQVLNAQVALETEPLQLEQSQLSLSQAQLRLDSARRAPEDLVLVTPAGGTVTVLDVEVGETVGAGTPVVVLSDLSTFVVEVNLDETDVAQAGVGQPVIVTLDAFPGVELSGGVTDVALVAESVSGVVLYPVTIQLSPIAGQEVDARAGMTADVEIVTASKEDVLIIPLRAIQSEDGKSYVWRQSAGGFEKTEVTLGVMTETEVEITSGLSEGDVVSVVASPSQGGGQPEFGPMRFFGGGEDD